MKIVWDERKRLANIDKHGFDFDELTAMFFRDAVIVPARGERFKAINRLSGSCVTAVFLGAGHGSGVGDQPASGERNGEGKPIMTTTRVFASGRGYSEADWNAVSEDADTTSEEMSKATTFARAFPDLAATMPIGPETAHAVKTLVSLRLSRDVVERFKADGPGWQSRIDDTLRKAVGL